MHADAELNIVSDDIQDEYDLLAHVNMVLHVQLNALKKYLPSIFCPFLITFVIENQSYSSNKAICIPWRYPIVCRWASE